MSEASRAFWGEMSACDHFVQIYETDDAFMDTLAGFVGGGLKQGDGAIVIATAAHRVALDRRLATEAIDVADLKSADHYLSLDAEAVLSEFMVNGWPDEKKFDETIRLMLRRAGRDGRRIRAFGEMVALMWAKGYCAATVRLEYLWQQLCEREAFTVFCAYPKSGFTENPSESIARLCEAHSKVFPS